MHLTWQRASRSLGATRLETLRHVVWPGVRPNILTGVRIAIGLLIDAGARLVLDSRRRRPRRSADVTAAGRPLPAGAGAR